MRSHLLGVAFMAVVGTACNEGPTAPTTGALEVRVVTTGSDLDSDGYDATVDGDLAESVAVNGAVVVSDLAVGTHMVALSRIAANCTVREEDGPNPRPVSVTAGDTTVVAFGIRCVTTGPARIAAVLGDDQEGTVGQALGLPFLVQVTDVQGVGLSGVAVSWTVTSGDGALDDEWEACSPFSNEFGDPTTTRVTRTNPGGYASVSFVPAAFGHTTVTAAVDGVYVSPAIFTTDATDPAASLSLGYPFDQQDVLDVIAGPQRQLDLQVGVTDGDGGGVRGVPVKWEVTAGSGDMRDLFGCWQQDDDPTTAVTRTYMDGGTQVSFQPTAFGITTVTATVEGVEGPPATFTLNATVYEIDLSTDADGNAHLIGPDYFFSDATVPVGATVEWSNENPSARISATSAPPGGTAFDSGLLGPGQRFRFVPQVAGTWEYVDQVSGITGTLTVGG